MTRPGIEPRSPGPLANTLPTRPMSQEEEEGQVTNLPTGTSGQGSSLSISKADCEGIWKTCVTQSK